MGEFIAINVVTASEHGVATTGPNCTPCRKYGVVFLDGLGGIARQGRDLVAEESSSPLRG